MKPDEIKQTLSNHLEWLENPEAGNRANLSNADLSNANLLCLGDMKYVKTLQIDTWGIAYTYDTLRIGCHAHAIKKWEKWETKAGEKWISGMDDEALSWAKVHLNIVLKLVEASPAKKPERI